MKFDDDAKIDIRSLKMAKKVDKDVFDKAKELLVVASEADFDTTWDTFMADYLSAGGQAIMDERAAKWAEYFGDADMLP